MYLLSNVLDSGFVGEFFSVVTLSCFVTGAAGEGRACGMLDSANPGEADYDHALQPLWGAANHNGQSLCCRFLGGHCGSESMSFGMRGASISALWGTVLGNCGLKFVFCFVIISRFLFARAFDSKCGRLGLPN